MVSSPMSYSFQWLKQSLMKASNRPEAPVFRSRADSILCRVSSIQPSRIFDCSLLMARSAAPL